MQFGFTFLRFESFKLGLRFPVSESGQLKCVALICIELLVVSLRLKSLGFQIQAIRLYTFEFPPRVLSGVGQYVLDEIILLIH